MMFLAAIGGFLGWVPRWLWLVLGLFCCGLLYGHWRFNAGQADVQGKWDASVERGKAEVARIKAEAGKVTTVIETQVVEKERVIRVKGETIVQVREVFVPADSGYLPGSFRLYFDAAIENAIPDPSRIPDAAPVAVTDVADTHAYNAEQCNIAYAKVEWWQRWATEQQRLNP